MPVVAADSLKLSHIRESTPGVTPTTPAFESWRLTSESLTFSPNTSASAELGVTGRFTRPANVVGTSVSGDINIELSRFPALDDAIRGILANPWGEGPLTPGSTGGAIDSVNRNTVGQRIETYTIEKRWPNINYTAGAMTIVATADAAPGASLDVTLTGGPAVGTGVIVVDYQTDADSRARRIVSAIAAGDTVTDAASTLATLLDAEANISASNVAGVVTITASGAATTISTLASRAGSDQYVYQRYRGCTYSQLTLSISPNQTITGAVSIVAGEPELDYLAIPGTSYNSSGTSQVFTAPDVLELTVGTIPGVATSCWTTVTLTLNSQNREIACIGSKGSRESALGTFTASMAGELYFVGDQTVLESLLNNETIGNSALVVTNADDEVYRFDLYSTKVIAGTLAAGGQNQDQTIPITLEPAPVTVQSDSGEDWTSGLIISKVNTAPTLP